MWSWLLVALTGSAIAVQANVAVSGTTIGATSQGSEGNLPSNGGTVWYSFTPAATGSYIISTSGSAILTHVHLYSGSALASVTLVRVGGSGRSGEACMNKSRDARRMALRLPPPCH